MESIAGRPDPHEAREALADIAHLQRAVRDTPWPTWLYIVNALLLGSMALTFTLAEYRNGVFTLVVFAVLGVNAAAGYRMGVPWALPTSRVFLAAVAVGGLCVVAAMGVADRPGWTWLIPLLAAAASASYFLGAVAHSRSTRRAR